jgi:RNA polymerase sigma-B factor
MGGGVVRDGMMGMTTEPPAPIDHRGPERTQLRRYARTRDADTRDWLIRRYLPLARYAASRYARGREPFDDLFQVASVGLLKALERYDPERGTAFATYALPTMTGELRRYFRDQTWAVRPPRDLMERALQLQRALPDLERRLGRRPTAEEVAARTGLSELEIREAHEALRARAAVSFSAPATDTEDLAHEERLGHDDEGYRDVEQRATVAALWKVLTAREREVLRLRFHEGMTQVEIGRRIGVSQMQVSRILRRSLERLAHTAYGAERLRGERLTTSAS